MTFLLATLLSMAQTPSADEQAKLLFTAIYVCAQSRDALDVECKGLDRAIVGNGDITRASVRVLKAALKLPGSKDV